MIRNAIILSMFLCFVRIDALAGLPESHDASIICIEHVGASDKMITPIVISDSELGIAKGRAYILKRTGMGVISAHVVSPDAMGKMLDVLSAAVGDKASNSGAFGTFSVTEMRLGTAHSIVLRRAKTLRLFKSLQAYCAGDPLFEALSELQSWLTSDGHASGGKR